MILNYYGQPDRPYRCLPVMKAYMSLSEATKSAMQADIPRAMAEYLIDHYNRLTTTSTAS